MELDDIHVAGTGCHLPDPMETADAERAGLCEHKDVWRTGIEAVGIAKESAPEMAAHAARQAMAEAGSRGVRGGADLLLHASVHYQGHDLWSAASFVQREAGCGTGPAIEVNQQSNGGMAAIELAAAFLMSGQSRRSALVTTGDRFRRPGFDRWRTDPGTICGDGGTALVLARGGGFARLRSIATVSDPGLETLGRGGAPFADAPAAPIDAETPRSEAISELGLGDVLERLRDGQVTAVETALAEARTRRDDIDWFVLPNLGRPKMDAQFFRPLGIARERTTWDRGRRVGHLGAGDQIAGLDGLVRSGRLRPGGRCLLAGVGAGFSWSAAVLEMGSGTGR